jgi:hypothetical protein
MIYQAMLGNAILNTPIVKAAITLPKHSNTDVMQFFKAFRDRLIHLSYLF